MEVSLGKILRPKLLLKCWSAPHMAAISVCMNYCKSLWTKHLLNVNVAVQIKYEPESCSETYFTERSSCNMILFDTSCMPYCFLSQKDFRAKTRHRPTRSTSHVSGTFNGLFDQREYHSPYVTVFSGHVAPVSKVCISPAGDSPVLFKTMFLYLFKTMTVVSESVTVL